MVLAWFLVAFSALVAGVAGDIVVESADTGGATIQGFGRTLLTPGLPEGAWILCGVAAFGVLLVTVAIANVWSHRVERRVAREIDARYEDLSLKEAGDLARSRLLEGRVAELQQTLEILTEQRDATADAVDRGRAQVLELRRVGNQQRQALRELAHLAEEQIVVIPDIPPELLVDADLHEVQVEGKDPIPLQDRPGANRR
jgi:uncharacterized membrane protein YccC